METPITSDRLGRACLLASLGCALAMVAASAQAQEPMREPVAIRFAATVGDQEFRCGQSYDGIGVTHSRITPSDLRFFVSDVRLVRADGSSESVRLEQDGEWQLEDMALLDFEDGTGPCRHGGNPATHTVIRGQVPPGPYQALRFTLGVPFQRNHGDASVAPAPLNLTALFWVWNAGYKFLKLDLASSGLPDRRSGDAPGDGRQMAVGFPVHIGSTGCAPGSKTSPPVSCKASNRVTVALDHFDPVRDVVVADVAALLRGADLDHNTANTAPGCMSEPNDPDCRPVFEAIGLGSGPQQFFRIQSAPAASP